MVTSINLLLDITDLSFRDFYLKYKDGLSPYYVFYYLFDRPEDPMEERVHYNEIMDFYKDKYTKEHIDIAYDNAKFNRLTLLSCSKKGNKNCNRNCHVCLGVGTPRPPHEW